MIRIALKNIWSRRRTICWLFVELVMVTIVGWIVLNPVAVGVYDSLTPYGYDIDRLVAVELDAYPAGSEFHDPAMSDSLTMEQGFGMIADILRNDPRVESVAMITTHSAVPGERETNLSFFRSEADTAGLAHYTVNYAPGVRYFTTIGIKSCPGSPSPEELDNLTLGSDEMIVTRESAEQLVPDGQWIGREIGYGDDDRMKIVAVVENVRMEPHTCNNITMFRSTPLSVFSNSPGYMVRLRSGEDAVSFAHDADFVASLTVGNLFASKVNAVTELRDRQAVSTGMANTMTVGMAMMVFFLISVILGVTGVFWMQTGKRASEAGVMKAFGARPAYIRRLMITESVIITVLAWAVGCVIYFQYVYLQGFDDKRILHSPDSVPADWVSDFSAHFAIISGLMLVLMLVSVVAGTYIPARRISSVNPVDALHDE